MGFLRGTLAGAVPPGDHHRETLLTGTPTLELSQGDIFKRDPLRVPPQRGPFSGPSQGKPRTTSVGSPSLRSPEEKTSEGPSQMYFVSGAPHGHPLFLTPQLGHSKPPSGTPSVVHTLGDTLSGTPLGGPFIRTPTAGPQVNAPSWSNTVESLRGPHIGDTFMEPL